jgi:hypothetical protein
MTDYKMSDDTRELLTEKMRRIGEQVYSRAVSRKHEEQRLVWSKEQTERDLVVLRELHQLTGGHDIAFKVSDDVQMLLTSDGRVLMHDSRDDKDFKSSGTPVEA